MDQVAEATLNANQTSFTAPVFEGEHQVDASPQTPLAQLWLTLPDEIKSRILTFAIGVDNGCDFLTEEIIENQLDQCPAKQKTWGSIKFALMFLPPSHEVSHIAREVFYRRSRAFVDATGDVPHQSFKYPSRPFNKYLPAIIFNISGFDTQFAFLKKVADKTVGFEGLKKVWLSVRVQNLWDSGYDDIKAAADFLANNIISFKVDILSVDYEPQDVVNSLWIEANPAEYDQAVTEMQRLERLVSQQISVGSTSSG